MTDLAAVWHVPLADGVHKVEFEHGTKSGKRIVRIDGNEFQKKNWCFRLVGTESFIFNGSSFVITIDTIEMFKYTYNLSVNGKDFGKLTANQSKILKCWEPCIGDSQYSVALATDTMDVWVNGVKKDTVNHFVDEGTEINFEIQNHEAFIRSTNSGNKREGLLYTLVINGYEMPPSSTPL